MLSLSTDLKPCQQCGQLFAPRSSFAKLCGAHRCTKAFLKGLERIRIDERNRVRARVAALKPRTAWIAHAQKNMNMWIRARDTAKGYGCISCGTFEGKKNAGHFLSTGARPELRFCEENIHLQCERCNTSLSGNLLNYRMALIDRIGIERVDWLEGPHEPKKYTIDQLKEIMADYRDRLKAMKAGHVVQAMPEGEG